MQKYEYFQTGMSENGTIHIKMMKNWVSHILFLRKRGLIVYLAALKEGAIRAAHPYYVIYRWLNPWASHFIHVAFSTVFDTSWVIN